MARAFFREPSVNRAARPAAPNNGRWEAASVESLAYTVDHAALEGLAEVIIEPSNLGRTLAFHLVLPMNQEGGPWAAFC